jgi:hypothetical protein
MTPSTRRPYAPTVSGKADEAGVCVTLASFLRIMTA